MHVINSSYGLAECSQCSKFFYLMRSLLQRKLGLVALHVWVLALALNWLFFSASKASLIFRLVKYS